MITGRIQKKMSLLSALALALLLLNLPMMAQLPTGTILGVVKDPSGAVIPGATVTILHTETNQTRTVASGGDGVYRVPALPVGRYTVKIEKTGFQTQTQTGLVLDVSQEMVVNFMLQVGATQQEVVVTAEAPLVNTTDSSLGGLVNESKIAELPLNGRNYTDLTLLQTGVTQLVGTISSLTQGFIFSSNGAPMRSNNYLLDGTSMQNFHGFTPSSVANTALGMDGIREYRVITNTFSAEYGLTMGSQMVIVSKGGSNQWNGDVFEYLRNASLDARNFFDAGIAYPGNRLAPFKRNNFGGALGGPIKKDKTFFFAVYEGVRERKGITNLLNTLPAADVPADPKNPADPAYTRNPGCGGCAVAPAIQPFLALFPAPNLPSNQFTYPYIQPIRDDYGQVRIDHNLSASDTFFGRFTTDDADKLLPLAFPQFHDHWTSRNTYLTLSESHVFSPSTLNTARLSFSRTIFSISAEDPSLCAPQYEMLPAGLDGGGCGPGILNIPGILGTGASSSAAGFGPPGIDPSIFRQNLYAFGDDFFWTKGKHGLKMGGLIQYYKDPVLASVSRGLATFSSVSSFLQGTGITAESGIAPGAIFDRIYSYNTYGVYLQDDYRMKPRLTLNLGLRYEFNTEPGIAGGRSLGLRNALTDKTLTPGPLINTPSKKNFSPRVGFAWDVFGNGKTSVRSGFGLYYDILNIGGALENVTYGSPPISYSISVTDPTGNLKFGTPLPAWTNFNLSTLIPTINVPTFYLKTPYLIQYNFSVEQQFPWGTALSVAYVGTRGIRLYQTKSADPFIPSGYLSNGLPFWDPFICNGALSPVTGSGCVANPTYHRVNPNFSSGSLFDNGAESWYNSLQVGVNKRLTRGLQFQSSYTWAKSLDDSPGILQSEAPAGSIYSYYGTIPRLDKGRSVLDVRQNWRFNLLYHFPNIQSNNFAAKLLHGWWTGNILSVQTGMPFNLSEANARSNSFSSGGERPNYVTSDNLAQAKIGNPNAVVYDPKTVIIGSPTMWYNPNIFTVQPVGQLGNVQHYLLSGPGLTEWDFSLAKDTAVKYLGERGGVQFRAEIFNILNHANFGQPVGSIFSGSATDPGVPLATAGRILQTSTSSRQIQFSLKLQF